MLPGWLKNGSEAIYILAGLEWKRVLQDFSEELNMSSSTDPSKRGDPKPDGEWKWLNNQEDRQWVIMESALDNARQLPRAIAGKEVDKQYRNDWDADDIVGAGSQNHPLLAAACELWYQIHRNRPKAIQVLEAWGRYAKLPYMTGEGFSPFIYGSWINLSILSAAVGARVLGREDIRTALFDLIRIGRSLMALSTAWENWNGNHPGRSCLWAGMRGWITVRDRYGGDYYNKKGVLNRPDNLDSCWATNFMSRMMGWGKAEGWIADVINALEGQVEPPLFDFLAGEREALEVLAAARTPLDSGGVSSLEWAVDFLNRATSKPMIRCRVIRTTDWVAFVCLDATNWGSTPPLYARLWFATRRPSGRRWDALQPHWNTDTKFAWMAPGPSVRQWGARGRGAVEVGQGYYTIDVMRTEAETQDGITIPANVHFRELDNAGKGNNHRKPASYEPGPWVERFDFRDRVCDIEYGPGGVTQHWPKSGGGNGNGGGGCLSRIFSIRTLAKMSRRSPLAARIINFHHCGAEKG
jgi:hypothetical protein